MGLSSLLALHKDAEPGSELPSPRAVQSELVEKEYLPLDLGTQLGRVRELTEPPADDEDAPPPSAAIGEAIVSAVEALVELGQKQVVQAGL